MIIFDILWSLLEFMQMYSIHFHCMEQSIPKTFPFVYHKGKKQSLE